MDWVTRLSEAYLNQGELIKEIKEHITSSLANHSNHRDDLHHIKILIENYEKINEHTINT